MAVYGSPLLDDAAIVHVVMISEQLLMISAGSFCNKWKYFCPLLGVGRAGGHELLFRRLEPLTWIFGNSAKKVAMMPMATCASAGGDPSWRGGGGAAAVAKESVLCVQKRLCYAKMAVYTVRITGWALKRKSWTGL